MARNGDNFWSQKPQVKVLKCVDGDWVCEVLFKSSYVCINTFQFSFGRPMLRDQGGESGL